MAILVQAATRILVQGITGREAVAMVRGALDGGARIVAGVTPGKGGQEVHGVPVFDSVREAQDRVGRVDVVLVSVPPAAARDALLEAVAAGVPLVVVTTERIPRRDVVEMLAYAAQQGSRVIGPNTLGLIAPGLTKVGAVGGPAEDTRRAYVPGPVGIMSRSGGMTTEIASLLTREGIGQSTCISIGGDPLVGSTFADLYPLFEADPETGVVVMYTEPGGTMEAELAEYLARERPATPGVVFVAGRFMDELVGVRFGHAGTIVQGKADSAAEKIRLLREAGLLVAEALSEIPDLVRRALSESRKPVRAPGAPPSSRPAAVASPPGRSDGEPRAGGGPPPLGPRLAAAPPSGPRLAAAPPSGPRLAAAPPSGPRPAAAPPSGGGLFVSVQVADGCTHAAGCRVCIDACPVDIFAEAGVAGGDERPKARVEARLEDECILCGLCVERCPEQVVSVVRLYADLDDTRSRS